MKKLILSLLFIAVLLGLAVKYRYEILIPLATPGEPIPLDYSKPMVPGATPFGDSEVFVTLEIDDATYAIAEPYSWARNFNYLFIGEDRALLLDAGVGHYDIRPVVKSLTRLPLRFMPSHFHYDHTGQAPFEKIALVDLPHLREQADGDVISPTWRQFLGVAEGVEPPKWTVSEWIKPGAEIDLGNRKLTLLFTPGHTDNSISLYDSHRMTLFSGDFISKHQMQAYYPGGSLGDYLQTSEKILENTDPATRLFSAHGSDDPNLPVLTHEDVTVLRDQIRKIKNGDLDYEGIYPVRYQVTPAQVLNAEHPWLQNWDITPQR